MMKRFCSAAGRRPCVGAALAIAASMGLAEQALAQQITRTVGEVKVLRPGAAATAARAGQFMQDHTALQTGADARAEVRFPGSVVVRAGANTVVGITGGGRVFDLRRGVVLVSMPRSATPNQLLSGGLVTTLNAATMIVEHAPPQFVKFMVLDGEPRVQLRANVAESTRLPPGRMLIVPPRGPLTAPVDFDIGAVLRSSRLLKNFPLLPTHGEMLRQVAKQKQDRTGGSLVETNLVIYGSGTLVTLVPPAQKTQSRRLPAKGTPSPSPTPRR